MASSSSAQPLANSAPRQSVTRSMSRRSLAPGPDGLAGALDEQHAPTARPRLPAKTPPRVGLPRSRTAADLAPSAALPRARSTTSIAARSSVPATKLATSQLATSRPRRILGESNAAGTSSNRTASSATSSSSFATTAPATTSSRAPSTTTTATTSRRYSRVEASRMTGMGVVRTGPPVQGQRHSPRKSASSSALSRDAVGGHRDAPVPSLARPSLGAEARREREVKPLPRSASATRVAEPSRVASSTEAALRTLSEEPTIQESFDEMMTSASVGSLASPAKRTVVGSVAMVRSPAARPPAIFGSGPSPSIVVNGGDIRSTPVAGASSQRLAVPRPSPARAALSPRSLAGRTALTRKLDEIESDSEEDDIDFLSPRKKAAKRIHLSASSPVAPGPASPARPVSHPSEPEQHDDDDDVTIHAPILPRSPSRRHVEPQQRTALPEATSVPMMRGGRTFPLPSLTAPSSSGMPTPRSTTGASSSASAMLPPLVMPRSRAPPLVINHDDRALGSSTSSSGFRPLRLTSSAMPAATSTGAGPSGSRLPRPQRVSLPAPAPVDTRPHLVDHVSAAPQAAVHEDVSMVVDDGPSTADVDADVSMCSAADASIISSASTASSTSSTSSRSEETARRLANLQSMLSRLQMPKPSAPSSRRTSAPTSTDQVLSYSSTTTTSTSSSRDYEVPLAPAHEPSTAPRTDLPRSRASLPSIVGPPPPAPATHVAPLLPSGPTARRRSTVVARPPGGIVNTASRPAPRAHGAASGPSAARSSSSTTAASTSASTASRPSARRISSTTLPSSASVGMSLSVDSTGAAALSGSVGRPKGNRAALQGVVACVDVRTAEGDDSGMVFVDLLKSMGARVTTRPSSVTTHIVFKAGRPSTLQSYRSLSPASRPHLVGIAWVVRCAELGAHADEAPFKVEDAAAPMPGLGKENAVRDVAAATAQAALGLGCSAPSKGGKDGGAGAGRRRKSMEPKALVALGNGASGSGSAGETGSGAQGGGTARDAALKASIAASIERARRKSLQFRPLVGSPLAKRVFVMPDAVEEGEE
ncbi:hypothetical protein JCM9279_001867 [Rhodotorula babjevae]